MAADLTLVQSPASPSVIDRGAALGTAEVLARTKQIREVMEKVMKPNVHYGVIPGTQKPTMYQPGADVLNVTFRIAPKVLHIDDLSTADEVRYRITVQGVHQVSQDVLAEGVGECSSNEEKYRWRKPVCDQEWDETAEDRRRAKWQRGQGGKTYKAKQIRTSPADVANTVLKMAVKRAKIAMTLNATAASDVFAQDLEDLSEELRESLAAADEAPPSTIQQPQRKSETTSNGPAGGARDAQTAASQSTGTSPTEPASAPAGVLIVDMERRRSQDGTKHWWIVMDDQERIAFLLESGETWQELYRVLLESKTQKRRVELDTERPEGAKYPNIIGVTPIGSVS